MKMKVVGFTCPFCNAPINSKIKEDADFLYCQSCGQKLFLEKTDNNMNMRIEINKNKKKTDVARIKESGDNKEVALARIAARKEADRSDYRLAVICILVLFLMPALPLSCVIHSDFEKREKVVQADEIKMPLSADSYEREYYESVVATLKGMGFEDIESIPIKDVSYKGGYEFNKIESISIAGDYEFEQYEIFKKTDKVVITYHALKET